MSSSERRPNSIINGHLNPVFLSFAILENEQILKRFRPITDRPAKIVTLANFEERIDRPSLDADIGKQCRHADQLLALLRNEHRGHRDHVSKLGKGNWPFEARRTTS